MFTFFLESLELLAGAFGELAGFLGLVCVLLQVLEARLSTIEDASMKDPKVPT